MATNTEQRTLEIILKAQDANASIKEMGAGAAVMTAQLSKMGQDDPGRAKLLADLQTMNQRLAASRQEMRAVVQTEEQLRDANAKLAAEQLQVVVNGQKVAASFDEMKASAALLERELGQMSADDPGRAKLLADYRALQGRIHDVRTEMGPATQEASKFKQMLGLVGLAFTAEAVIDGVSGIGKSIFETTAKFETYGVVLKQALGSESAAQAALHDIQTMAAKTPFSVDELTASFIKFVNRGLTPSMAEMTKLADLAASQGKSFEQLTEAVLDAGTGEFERLKEFGIQASKNGDVVSLAFKGVKKEVANTPEAINAALMSFGELKGVMGDTAAISKTLAGETSNLGDTADQVAIQYGGMLRPVFIAIIRTIGTFLGILKEIPSFVSENRGLILGLAVAVLALNGAQVTATASTLYGLAVEKARAVATRASAAAQWLLNAALTANPIGIVIAVVALLVGGLITLYERSDKVRAVVAGMGAAFMALVTTIKNGVMQGLNGVADVLVGIFTMNPAKIKAGMDSILGGLKAVYWDAGRNAGMAYMQGYDEKIKSEHEKQVGNIGEIMAKLQLKLAKQADEAAKKRIAAEKAALLESLKNEEANLKVRLSQAEEGSRQEMKLKQQLIAVQAKIELEDAKKTENEKRVIRAEAQGKIQDLEDAYNKKRAKEREDERKRLEKAAEEAAKAELAVQHSIQDLRVGLIKNAHMRELAELDLQTARKIEQLKGSEGQIAEQTSYLLLAKQAKIAELQAKWDEEDRRKAEEKQQERLELSDAADEEYAAYLENKVANGLMTEQAYQDALYEIRKQALENQLQLLVDAGQGETAEARRIRAALLRGEAEHTAGVKKQEEAQLKLKRAMASEARFLLADSLGFLVDNLGQQTVAYGVFKQAMKALQLAEIGINLQGELQANALAAAKNPANGPTAGFAGISQLALANALSYGRAIIAGIKVSAFEKGGRTDSGLNQFPLASLAGMLSGASGGSFAGGGVVPGAQIGLIGEAGAELVIPNWLFTDPKQANLMGYLEAQIANRGNAFADGGRTVDRGSGVVTGPAAGETPSGAMLTVLERIAKGQEEFRDEISTWQRELETNVDLFKLKKNLETIDKTQTGGGLK